MEYILEQAFLLFVGIVDVPLLPLCPEMTFSAHRLPRKQKLMNFLSHELVMWGGGAVGALGAHITKPTTDRQHPPARSHRLTTDWLNLNKEQARNAEYLHIKGCNVSHLSIYCAGFNCFRRQVHGTS